MSARSKLAVCDICGDPITDLAKAARKITGWEVPREAGGTNHILGRQGLDRLAHPVCVKVGPPARRHDQGSFL